VPRGTSTSSCRSVGTRRRVGVKDPVVANPGEAFAALVGQAMANGDRVVASVEDEQRYFPVVGKESDETADLFGGGSDGVLERRDPLHVEGRGPRVECPVQLANPLI
jgi:hypothetical protein